ncbi:hypothetical protein HY484_01895 [Candidatus Woesearchaeota archaeon]|nr:hypothetical protein [Candidatus Woesearchaeota archaeon]
MIIEVILLIIIILNLMLMSILAFLGEKNWLLVSAIIEALLGIAFSLLVS